MQRKREVREQENEEKKQKVDLPFVGSSRKTNCAEKEREVIYTSQQLRPQIQFHFRHKRNCTEKGQTISGAECTIFRTQRRKESEERKNKRFDGIKKQRCLATGSA